MPRALAPWVGLRERLGRAGFYLLFALAVTASVQLVGVYLVFASLIAPAVATRSLPGRPRISFAFLVGGLAYAAGLGISLTADLPAGAAVVCALGVAAIGSLFLFKD